MAMNYLAVMVCPFILTLARDIFHLHNEVFAFRMNAVLVLILAVAAAFQRRGFVLGLDERYYVQQ